jgi:hypothetical protein
MLCSREVSGTNVEQTSRLLRRRTCWCGHSVPEKRGFLLEFFRLTAREQVAADQIDTSFPDIEFYGTALTTYV